MREGRRGAICQRWLPPWSRAVPDYLFLRATPACTCCCLLQLHRNSVVPRLACCRNSVAQLFRVATPSLLLACLLARFLSFLSWWAGRKAQNLPPAQWQMSQQQISQLGHTERIHWAMSVTQDTGVEKSNLFSPDRAIPIDITRTKKADTFAIIWLRSVQLVLLWSD